MARYTFNLPDIGEGIAEAEIVAWHVKIGDMVEEDGRLADMMTDKATVEMESPVSGRIVQVAGEEGDVIAIGSPLVVIETDAEIAGALAHGRGGESLGTLLRRLSLARFDFGLRPPLSTNGLLGNIGDWNRRFLLGRGIDRSVGERHFILRFIRRRRTIGFEHGEDRANRYLLADITGQLHHLARDGRFHFDRRLVGHHVGELLIFLDAVADLDVPGDDLRLGNAFADVRQPEFESGHSPQASNVFLMAVPMRTGPGK